MRLGPASPAGAEYRLTPSLPRRSPPVPHLVLHPRLGRAGLPPRVLHGLGESPSSHFTPLPLVAGRPAPMIALTPAVADSPADRQPHPALHLGHHRRGWILRVLRLPAEHLRQRGGNPALRAGAAPAMGAAPAASLRTPFRYQPPTTYAKRLADRARHVSVSVTALTSVDVSCAVDCAPLIESGRPRQWMDRWVGLHEVQLCRVLTWGRLGLIAPVEAELGWSRLPPDHWQSHPEIPTH